MPQVSTNLSHPSRAATLGELRTLTAHLPDSTPLMIEDAGDQFPPPPLYFDTGECALVFLAPL